MTMSDAEAALAERNDHLPDVARWLLRAGRVREAAERLKKFAHARAALRDRRPHGVRSLIEDLVHACEALPDDEDLASWRRFVSRNAHRLERGGLQALVQLSLEAGDDSPIGRAVRHGLARGYYQDVWFQKRGPTDTTGESCSLVLEGHRDAVFGVAWLPGGREALTGGADGTLRHWDAETGRMLRSISVDGHQPRDERESVLCIAVGPDGFNAIVGNRVGEVSSWDLRTGALRWRAAAHGKQVNGLCVAGDGTRLVSCGGVSTRGVDAIVVWDLESGKRLCSATAVATAVVLLPDERTLVSVDHGGTLTFWNLENLAVQEQTPGGPAGACAVVPALGGTVLVVAGRESLVTVHLETRRVLAAWDLPKGFARALAVHPDGEQVFFTHGFTIATFSLTQGVWQHGFDGLGGRATAVAVHPQGNSVFWASEEGSVRRLELPTSSVPRRRAHESEVTGVVFDAARSRLLSVGHDGRIVAWDPVAGTEVGRLSGPSHAAVALEIDASSNHLIVASEDGTIIVWDLSTDSCLRTFETRTYGLNLLAVVEGGQVVATAGGYLIDDAPGSEPTATHQIRLWRVRDGVLVGTLEGHPDELTALTYHPKVGLVSVGFEGSLRVWDIEHQTLARVILAGTSRVLGVVSGTSQILAGEKALRCWDLSTGELACEFPPAGGRFRALRVSSDGRTAVTLGLDRALCLWDLERGLCVAKSEADVAARAVTLTPDGVVGLGDDSGAVTFLELRRSPQTATRTTTSPAAELQ